ncbi:MAG: MG(2+) CHELATASE FAMILY PROTEIN / ComM-related protein [uncultured Sulfurovum sp.]|uniref:MG(2+) CHELATASE FAMILY PROTEIN / ComM-related protein n=1 Tax=uncultured Sulfurovum sp. TaxID=269237 RepID=A0A6S6UKA9_9BACT|nr:MAG: MG(2+) CHELATASE FAMILY PROTEIN / ComM-related protein [uncultured Sulfurovum sp.]
MNAKIDSGTPPQKRTPQTKIKQKAKKESIVNRLSCATLEGVNAKVIEVEATFTKGLPGFAVVGLASTDIQEAKERVKSALLTNEFVFPPLKITIGLSPSEIKKNGSQFDLSLGLLIALNKKSFEEEGLFVFGELGLDGRVKSSSMIFPLVLSLKEQGLIQRAIVPKEAIGYLSHISGVDFIAVETLGEAIHLLSKGEFATNVKKFDYDANSFTLEKTAYYYKEKYESDFSDVKGQMVAKRAALIAAAGMHNFFMEGNPGCGKSMIAKRIKDILPPMQEEELLSIAKHQFLDGQVPSFDAVRPMRSPHHTATSASIFGGGSGQAKIGEVALASKGILFFDEIPHFSKNILEALREPLQDKKVHIARVNAKIEYEADIMFVAAQNPCPCGNLLSKVQSCRCTEVEIKRYQNKLSDPFLDRIDLFVVMQEVRSEDKADVNSKSMHQEVIEAFKMQKKRGQVRLNGKLSEDEIESFCCLQSDALVLLEGAIRKFGLSHRSIASIKKIGRTIADLNKHTYIEKRDILEALSYRRRK